MGQKKALLQRSVCGFLALCLSCGFQEIVWGALSVSKRGEERERTKLAIPLAKEGRKRDEEEKVEMPPYYFLSFLLQPPFGACIQVRVSCKKSWV